MWEAIPGSHNPLCILISFQFLRWHSLLPPPPSLQELWPGWLRQQANNLLVCSTSTPQRVQYFNRTETIFLEAGEATNSGTTLSCQTCWPPIHGWKHAHVRATGSFEPLPCILKPCELRNRHSELEDLKRRFWQSWAPTCADMHANFLKSV